MLPPLPGGCALTAIASALLYNDTCGLLNTSALHVQYETGHLLNLRVQNELDYISEKFNLKNFSGGACARNSLEKCATILPLYTISLGALYHKILRPPLKNADFVFAFVRQLLLLLFFENGQLYPFDDFCVAYIYYFVNIIL